MLTRTSNDPTVGLPRSAQSTQVARLQRQLPAAQTDPALIVGLGVLLDTLLVRTVLVPALVHVLGDRFWLPGRLPETPATRYDRPTEHRAGIPSHAGP